jgi:hypothetical protein
VDAPWPVGNLAEWLPARSHPETYPGERPPSAYLLLEDKVLPMDVRGADDVQVFSATGRWQPVDALLEAARLPALADRVAVLAYGANRNPATLRIKLRNYGYRSPGSAIAVPVLRGRIRGADVVACGLSGQGYFYGDLVSVPELTASTQVEVWVGLLDPDQLRVMHESEIGTGDYVAALIPRVTVEPFGAEMGILGYAANAPCVVSPALGLPIAFSSIEATHRAIPAMDPMAMLDHLAGAFGLKAAVRAAAQLDESSFAPTLSRYMNANWWRGFESTAAPDPAFKQILRLFSEAIHGSALAESSAQRLGQQGLTLSNEEAYAPPPTLTWGSHMAML